MGGRGSSSSKSVDPEEFGRVWEKYGKKRLYLDEQKVMKEMGFELDFYKSGNIAYAELNGEKISNNKAWEVRSDLLNSYIDFHTGLIYSRHGLTEDELAAMIDKVKPSMILMYGKAVPEACGGVEFKSYEDDTFGLKFAGRTKKEMTKTK